MQFSERVWDPAEAQSGRGEEWGGVHCNYFGQNSHAEENKKGSIRTNSIPAAGNSDRSQFLHGLSRGGVTEKGPCRGDGFVATGVAQRKCVVIIRRFGEIERASRCIVAVVGVQQSKYIVCLDSINIDLLILRYQSQGNTVNTTSLRKRILSKVTPFFAKSSSGFKLRFRCRDRNGMRRNCLPCGVATHPSPVGGAAISSSWVISDVAISCGTFQYSRSAPSSPNASLVLSQLPLSYTLTNTFSGPSFLARSVTAWLQWLRRITSLFQ